MNDASPAQPSGPADSPATPATADTGDAADAGDTAADTTTLRGKSFALAEIDDAQRQAALNEAFDYRGNVTLTLTDGSTMEGYIFDRRGRGEDAYVRIWPADRDEKVDIPYGDIACLAFTGRDTAEGKSWETWVSKYYEKKAKGEEASIYAEEH